MALNVFGTPSKISVMGQLDDVAHDKPAAQAIAAAANLQTAPEAEEEKKEDGEEEGGAK